MTNGSISGRFANGCSSMLNPDEKFQSVFVATGVKTLVIRCVSTGSGVEVGKKVMFGYSVRLGVKVAGVAGLAVQAARARRTT